MAYLFGMDSPGSQSRSQFSRVFYRSRFPGFGFFGLSDPLICGVELDHCRGSEIRIMYPRIFFSNFQMIALVVILFLVVLLAIYNCHYKRLKLPPGLIIFNPVLIRLTF